MRRFLLAVLVVLLPASAAATLLQVRLDLSFNYPPNPCTGNDLRNATLGGVARLFHQPTRAGDPVEVGRWTASDLACAASAGSDLAVDLTGDGALLVDFAGQLAGIATRFGVFAMADVGAERPTDAPLLEVGKFSGGAFAAGNVQQWPLLAYASPGQQIGTLGVRVVSEPGGGALLVTSLLLAAVVHRRPGVPRLAPAVRSSGMRHDSTRQQARSRAGFLDAEPPVRPRASARGRSHARAASERESRTMQSILRLPRGSFARFLLGAGLALALAAR